MPPKQLELVMITIQKTTGTKESGRGDRKMTCNQNDYSNTTTISKLTTTKAFVSVLQNVIHVVYNEYYVELYYMLKVFENKNV